MLTLSYLLIFPAWRYYDGRGYPKSEVAGWVIGAALGALTFGLDAPWQQMVYGAAIGALATWCIVAAYKQTPKGWRSYRSMALRSKSALAIPAVAFVASQFGVDVGPNTVFVVAMCFAANVTQVPLRRHQRTVDETPAEKRPKYGKYMAEICETWEALWIGGALALLGAF